MKFCFITESWPGSNEAHISGSAVQIYYIAQTLSRRGHNILVILTTGKTPPTKPDLPIKFLRGNKHKRLLERLNGKKNRKMIRNASEFKPDYVYQRGKLPETVIAHKIAKQSGARFIWASNSDKSGERWKYVRSQWSKKSLKRFLTLFEAFCTDVHIQSAMKNADLVLAQTVHQQKELLNNYGIQAIRFQSGHPIPSIRIKKTNKIPVVLWVANLTPIKRPLLFARLAEESVHLRAKFVMVGHARETGISAKIKDYAEKLPNFEYLGGASLQDINRIMQKADIFTLSSTHEGIANTFIQACINALPTISLGHEPEDWISKYQLGAIVSDYNEWKITMHQFIIDKKSRQNAGQKAYDFALQNFDIEKLVDRFLEMILISYK
jgi:glycosyltransferase involved in cell wall biosynthesis